MRICCIGALMLTASVGYAQESSLADALLFHASFDESADADFAKGDARIYTAKSLKREDVRAGLHSDAVSLKRKHGRYGGSLSFTKKSDQIVFFKGAGNLPPAQQDFHGSYSFWLRLTPEQDDIPLLTPPSMIEATESWTKLRSPGQGTKTKK